MKSASRTARLAAWLIWPACVLVVFILRFDYLSQGFYIEDVLFLGMEYSDTQPGMNAVINSPGDALGFFRVDRGWFYRPFFLLYIGGLQLLFGNDPVAFHAASLLLHGTAMALAVSLVLCLTQNKLAAFFAAALFLTWPEKEQAVWWISSASTLLATVFALICLQLWLWFRETGHGVFYALSLVAALLAMGSKNEGVCLVLFGLTALEIVVRPAHARSITQYLPFLLLAVLYLVTEGVSLQSFPDQSAIASLSLRWLALLEADITAGMSQRPLLLVPCILAFLVAAKDRSTLSLGLIAIGALSAKSLAFGLGTGIFPSRFYYAPALFISCGLAVILASGQATTARFFFALVVVAGITAAHGSIELSRLSFYEQGILLLVTIAVAFALRKRQNECGAIYPLTVPMAFWICADGPAVECVIVCVTAFAMVWVMHHYKIQCTMPFRIANATIRKPTQQN